MTEDTKTLQQYHDDFGKMNIMDSMLLPENWSAAAYAAQRYKMQNPAWNFKILSKPRGTILFCVSAKGPQS